MLRTVWKYKHAGDFHVYFWGGVGGGVLFGEVRRGGEFISWGGGGSLINPRHCSKSLICMHDNATIALAHLN